MPNAKREPAILAALIPGEWLSHHQIHRRLSADCRCQFNAEKATSYTCRRLANVGKLRERKTARADHGHHKQYALPEEVSS